MNASIKIDTTETFLFIYVCVCFFEKAWLKFKLGDIKAMLLHTDIHTNRKYLTLASLLAKKSNKTNKKH